jgi:hypothetical protein
MRFKRRKRSDSANWVLIAGVALTGAAALYALSRLMKSAPVAGRLERRGLEKSVLQALLSDEVARTQGIDIAAVGSGVIEVSGTISSQSDARHVVSVIDAVPGVHAVLNRLEIPSVETRLERNSRKNAGESPRWYGGSVGIGKRRQGVSTDPHQRDDSVALRSRALQPNRDDVLTDVEETEGTGVRIGVTNSNNFDTHVQPRSPDRSSDMPGPPPAADKSEPRQPV